MAAMAFGSVCAVCAGTPLTSGTTVQLVVNEDATSRYVTNPVVVVASDVIVNGHVLIRKGTPVIAQLDTQRARGCGRPGTLVMRFLSTTSTDGQNILLQGGSLTATGQNKKGLAIGLGVGTGVTFLPGIGLAFLAIKGGEAVIPTGSVANNVLVANNYDIQ